MHVGLITGIFPPDIGGPATFISALGKGLTERGHTVEVVTYSELPRPGNGWPFRVRRVLRSASTRRLQVLAAIVRMARRADVLLANGLLHATTLANMIVRRPCAVKVVGDFAWERARNRNLTTQEFTAFQSAAHARPLACWQRERTRCLNRARAVLVPSEFLRCVVEAWGITRPIHVIPNGIDDAFVRAADGADLDEIRREYTLSDRFLLYAGRLTNWKGCDTLIRLLPKLAADLGLVIVGDGPERGALKAIAKRLDLGKRVRFVPPVDRARTAALMRLAA
jgi:glycosyltransferase involved in cell wall biosynthesis